VSIPEELLSILACIECGTTPLEQEHDALRCPECGRTYPVEDGIPVMLPLDEGENEAG